MSIGQVINGYTLAQEFTTTGGGLCRWCFADKDGKQYFLKEFLSPKYPTPDSPGSEKLKVRKLERCEQFESHHRELQRAISTSSKAGGNLVITVDFFRNGTTYYKVTDKVDTTSLRPTEISALPIGQRVLILKTVTHSLSVLHQLRIVHGDLKPDNILIKKTPAGEYIAKLIDFDNSYFAKAPPQISADSDIVGDPFYYSPELGRYVMRDGSTRDEDLQTSSDIFALGVVFCQYLTGKPPVFDKKHRYAWEAASNGADVFIDSTGQPPSLSELVNGMLSTSAIDRPAVQHVFAKLKSWDRPRIAPEGSLPTGPIGTGLGGAATDISRTGRLHGTMSGDRTGAVGTGTEVGGIAASASRLKISTSEKSDKSPGTPTTETGELGDSGSASSGVPSRLKGKLIDKKK